MCFIQNSSNPKPQGLKLNNKWLRGCLILLVLLSGCQNEPVHISKETRAEKALSPAQIEAQMQAMTKTQEFVGLYNVNIAMAYYMRDTGLTFEELKAFCFDPTKYDRYHSIMAQKGVNSGMVAYFMQQLNVFSHKLIEQYPDLKASAALRETLQGAVNEHSIKLLEYYSPKKAENSTTQKDGWVGLGGPCDDTEDCVVPLICTIDTTDKYYTTCQSWYMFGGVSPELDEVLVIAPKKEITTPKLIPIRDGYAFNPFDNGNNYYGGHLVFPNNGSSGGGANRPPVTSVGNFKSYGIRPFLDKISALLDYEVNFNIMTAAQIEASITDALAEELDVEEFYVRGIGYEQRVRLLLFLLEENTDSADRFGTEALIAFSKGGEVDFVNRIFNELKGKERCAYNILKNTNGNLFKETIGIFDVPGEKYNLILTYGKCPSSNGDACTDPSKLSNNTITIKIANTNLSVLEQAATILHEGIHAEIYRYVHQNGGNVDPNEVVSH